MKGLTWRIVTVWATVIFSVYLLVPSIISFKTGEPIPKHATADDPWYYSVIPSQVLKLGLDLRGGTHLVLGIDQKDARQNTLSSLKKSLTDVFERDKIAGVTVTTTSDDRIAIKHPADKRQEVQKVLSGQFDTQLEFVSQSSDSAVLRLTTEYEDRSQKETVDQALDSIRRRIDEFGVSEPIITKQGEDKIMVQFPGEQNPQRLKDIISRTAKLTFQIARSGAEVQNSNPPVSQLQTWVAEFKKEKNVGNDPKKPVYLFQREMNEYLAKKLPANTEIVFKKETNINTGEVTYEPNLLDKEPIATGDQLEDAKYGFTDKEGAVVYFTMKPDAAVTFGKGTGANVGKQMAIVLDNLVHSAPTLQSKIESSGQITFGGRGSKTNEEQYQEARDTSLVLRSGALPARLEILEERIVGPSLGRDAIKQGTFSLIAGLILVYIFMFIYYRGAGGVACVALTLNGLFIFAILAAFEGTLTLPGLAGVTLTLGMAVDANVLIFEHIREELRAGRSVNTAIAEGYHRAFSAIIDTHVTTIISGIILLEFGYGPIRGFAVTLLIGLTASLYTAVFVTRVIYDTFVVSKGRKTISI